MNKINLVKKTYEELQDEVIKLTTDKFLLQNRIDKATKFINENMRTNFEYPDYVEMLLEEKNELLDILKESGE